MEANMQVLEGAQYRLRVKLTNEAGEQLPPELFRVYAGAFCPGYAPAHFHAERTAEEWVLTMPGLKPGRVPWNWQVIAAEYATGVEWLLAAGEVNVTARHATGSGCVDPGELKIVATLDKTTLQMTVQIGESTAACSLAVVAAQNSAKEADANAKLAAGSADHAAEQAQAAETARKQADGSATDAAASAADAHGQATAADASATDAANSASAAAAEVEKAAAEVEKAKLERETAATHATTAAKSAQEALSNLQGAEQAAQDAAQAQVAATTAKSDAEAAKVQAQTAEQKAKTSADTAAADKIAAEQARQDAQTAQSKAEDKAAEAEQSAALLGDAALKSADNEFSGCNVFSGESVGVLPADFMRFAWVDSVETLKLLCPNLNQRKSWYYFTPRISGSYIVNGGDSYARSVYEDIVFYSEASKYIGPVLGYNVANMKRLVLVMPNLTSSFWPVSNNYVGGEFVIDECDIYAPNAKMAVCRRARLRSLRMQSADTELIDTRLELSSSSKNNLRRLEFPFNVIKRIDMQNMKVLCEVLSDFPVAELINFQNAVLDKASVLRILGGLQPYDAAAMSAVPELTLGIDPALDGDEEINAALLNAQAAVEDGGKGWNVAANGFTITAGGVATMGLRKPVYARRWQDDEGGWVDTEGTRWAVRYGNTVLENWIANEQLGYVEFATLEDALEQWGLREYQPEEAIDY